MTLSHLELSICSQLHLSLASDHLEMTIWVGWVLNTNTYPTPSFRSFHKTAVEVKPMLVWMSTDGSRPQGWNVSSLELVCLLVGCLTSQQQASVSQGRICSDNCTCCHTEIEVADPTFYLTQSQYTDTRPTSPSADPITPGAWQGSHWSASC